MILSFGFKNGKGVPTNASKVFDIRDLSHDTKSIWFKARMQEILDYAKQHPKQVIAVGCEEGQHRSRVMVDEVARQLRASKFHRDYTPKQKA